MSADGDLRRLGAGARVRAALAALPDAFAEAVAAEAWRLVEGGRVPLYPVTADALPPAPCGKPPSVEARAALPRVASLALALWRIVAALLRLDAGRLLAACNAFRVHVLPAWEAAHGRRLAPTGDDWPPLPSREFLEYD